jgi:hypothetical protein
MGGWLGAPASAAPERGVHPTMPRRGSPHARPWYPADLTARPTWGRVAGFGLYDRYESVRTKQRKNDQCDQNDQRLP